MECFRRVNSGGECGAPRGGRGGIHGVQGVPREAFQPGDLAFPPISSPARRTRPLVFRRWEPRPGGVQRGKLLFSQPALLLKEVGVPCRDPGKGRGPPVSARIHRAQAHPSSSRPRGPSRSRRREVESPLAGNPRVSRGRAWSNRYRFWTQANFGQWKTDFSRAVFQKGRRRSLSVVRLQDWPAARLLLGGGSICFSPSLITQPDMPPPPRPAPSPPRRPLPQPRPKAKERR